MMVKLHGITDRELFGREVTQDETMYPKLVKHNPGRLCKEEQGNCPYATKSYL